MSRSASNDNPFITGQDRIAGPEASGSDDGASERSAEHAVQRYESRSVHSRSSSRHEDDFGGEKYSEKSSEYGRYNTMTPGAPPGRDVYTDYAGSFAPNPSFIRLLRFLLYGISSLSALATAGVAIAVVNYYNTHRPAIDPSWGSLIALIVFGIITPGFLFIPFLFTPRMFRYGTALGIVNQVRVELLNLFALAVIWVSGALAMANDLRGYENCIWDGYYHYPKPSDFNNVCDLINATVIMGYVTFGLITLTWFVVTALAIYILLYLDQEVLSELTNDMGGRAYRARTFARQSMQQPQVMPTNVDGHHPVAAPAAPSMHRRTSSGSRRSQGYIDYEQEYLPRDEASVSQFEAEGDHVSRRIPQIPNPDAAVPMSEKRALAQRYGDDRDVERGGPMVR